MGTEPFATYSPVVLLLAVILFAWISMIKSSGTLGKIMVMVSTRHFKWSAYSERVEKIYVPISTVILRSISGEILEYE